MSPRRTGLRRAGVVLLALAALGLVLRFLHYEGRLLAFPFPWDSREALSLHHALLFSEGVNPYLPRSEPPLVILPYGPVYPLVVAPLVRVFGRSLLGPRLVSFVSLAALLMGVAAATRRLTGRWVAGLVAAGWVVLKCDWWRWLAECRPDALGTLLLFLSLYLAWRWPRSRLAGVLSACAAVTAFFTKVYLAMGCASVFLALWLVHRDRRAALRYALVCTGLLAAGVFLMMVATEGWYYVHTFQIMAFWTGRSITTSAALSAKLVIFFSPLWLLMAKAVRDRRLDPARYGPLWVHLLVGAPLTALLLVNDGSAGHYWFTVVPAAAIIGSDLLFQELSRPGSRAALPALALGLLAMLAGPGRIAPPGPRHAERWLPLQDKVRQARGPVMNDDLTALLNLEAGRPLHSEGLGFLRNLEWMRRTQGLSFVDLEDRIRRRYYALILNPEPALPVAPYYRKTASFEVPLDFGATWRRVDAYEPNP